MRKERGRKLTKRGRLFLDEINIGKGRNIVKLIFGNKTNKAIKKFMQQYRQTTLCR